MDQRVAPDGPLPTVRTVKMTVEMAERIDAAADHQGITASALTRRYIRDGLAADGHWPRLATD